MKKNFTLRICMFCFLSFSQNKNFTVQEINTKLDSIKAEGNLLYALETASWNATDLARENEAIKTLLGSYLTYKNGEYTKNVFLNKSADKVIAEYDFLDGAKIPVNQKTTVRNLSEIEKNLKNIRQKLIIHFSDPANEVGAPKGFSLNIITIPFGEQFKTYLIPGTSQSNIIPFGNDYLFITDKFGKILNSKKIHSGIIPTFGEDSEGNITRVSTHSHTKENPFISATDICTFRLYAPYTKLTKFSVYSPALKTYFQYDSADDTLKVVESPL